MRCFELDVQRRNTMQYIDDEGIPIILSRVERVSDGAGAYKRGSTTPIGSQQMVMQSPTVQLPVRRTIDGIEVTPEYMLVGRWDVDVVPGDWFWVDGIKYEVVFVHPDRDYQTVAEVAYRG